MHIRLSRRRLLTIAGAATLPFALTGCAGRTLPDRVGPPPHALPPVALPPVRTAVDRITDITVCLRPFRPDGPRIAVEPVAGKTVVHHYGHGGSGWSLAWGSAVIAGELAMRAAAAGPGPVDIAVIGCGAIGLTSAIQLQRMGARATIYTRDMPPAVPSAAASGVWSPDSRICFQPQATPALKAMWERMCRLSFKAYQDKLGLPGMPVEWVDLFIVQRPPAASPAPPPAVAPAAAPAGEAEAADPRPAFATLRRELTPDLHPVSTVLEPGAHPFGDRPVRRNSNLIFNIAPYTRLLLEDFHRQGGRIVIRRFDRPADLATLPEPVVMNCTGYGAKALFGDDSLMPVRGQLARTAPQEDVRYMLYADQVSFVPRRDGWVFQVVGPNDYYGYGSDDLTPDRAEAERAVSTITALFPQV
jgi:glycine/D-amino acid oxidase-like deaminating enzyme